MEKKTDGEVKSHEFICTSRNRHWFEACPDGNYYASNPEKGCYEIKTREGRFLRTVCCPDCGRYDRVIRPWTLRW